MFEKKMKKTVFETVFWLLADQFKNLIEKKWPGLSDSDMVNGGMGYTTRFGAIKKEVI